MCVCVCVLGREGESEEGSGGVREGGSVCEGECEGERGRERV